MSILKKTLLGTSLAISLAISPTVVSAETLNFVSWMKGDPGYGDWWAEVIAEYEETHPGDTIEWTKVARSDYANAMFTMFASDSPPEIVHLAAFEYQPFAEEGWLEDLGPWIAKDGPDLAGWAGQKTCEWNGTTNCIMLLYTGYILAYNEKALKDGGIEKPPVGWDEFLAAARAATRDTDGDGVTDVFGVGLPMKGEGSVIHTYLSFVLDAGGAWTVDGEPTFDNPGTIEGLRRWKQLYDEGLTPRDLTSGDVRQLFIEGKIAMTVDGPWVYNAIKTAADDVRPDLKLAMSPFSPPVGGTSNVITMPSDLDDAKKELVWDFIQIATSEKFQQRFATLGSSPAPMAGLDYSAEIAADPYFDLFVKANAAASDAGIDRLPKGLEVEFNEVQNIFFRETQRMVIEDLDPADVAKTIQAEVLALK